MHSVPRVHCLRCLGVYTPAAPQSNVGLQLTASNTVNTMFVAFMPNAINDGRAGLWRLRHMPAVPNLPTQATQAGWAPNPICLFMPTCQWTSAPKYACSSDCGLHRHAICAHPLLQRPSLPVPSRASRSRPQSWIAGFCDQVAVRVVKASFRGCEASGSPS